VNNIDLPVIRKQAIERSKRIRHIIPLITATVLSVSLVAAVVVPANAAVREPARTAPISLTSGDTALAAVPLTSAARYVHLSRGRFTVDTLDAEKAGVNGQALSTESALAVGMNRLLDRGAATVNSARDGVVVNAAKAVPASVQDTIITVLPGITLSITSTGIQLSMTAEAVTEVENTASFAGNVANLVGDILGIALAAVPNGGAGIASGIADLVADAIGIGSDFLKFCTASNGSATFTIPWPWLWLSLDLPSCSGISL
jgi:hypothetical protein